MTDYFLQLFEANRPKQEEKDRQQVTAPDSVGTLWLGPRVPQRAYKEYGAEFTEPAQSK
jgi:hypothetical protein